MNNNPQPERDRQFVYIPTYVTYGKNVGISYTTNNVHQNLPATNGPTSNSDKKWTTFRLSSCDKSVVVPVLNCTSHSFVKLGSNASTSSVYPPNPQLIETVDLTRSGTTDSRTCSSPESGIDCDDVSTDLQLSDVTKESSSTVTDCHAEELAPPVGREETIVENPAENLMKDAGHEDKYAEIESTTVNVVNDTNDAKECCSGNSAERNRDDYCGIMEQEDQENYSAEESDETLQIISVHSLAVKDDTAESSPVTPILNKVDTLKERGKSLFNEPLAGCRRLYVRRIKGLHSGMKRVLVVEADYSKAAPLPVQIMNKLEKKKEIVRIKQEPVYLKENETQVSSPKKQFTPRRKRKSTVQSTSSEVKLKNIKIFTPTKTGTGRLTRKRGLFTRMETEDANEDEETMKDAERASNEFDEYLIHCEESECEDWQNEYRIERGAEKELTKKVFDAKKSRTSRLTAKTNSKVDRISLLKEKLRQKEADIEKIRKNVDSLKDISMT